MNISVFSYGYLHETLLLVFLLKNEFFCCRNQCLWRGELDPGPAVPAAHLPLPRKHPAASEKNVWWVDRSFGILDVDPHTSWCLFGHVCEDMPSKYRAPDWQFGSKNKFKTHKNANQWVNWATRQYRERFIFVWWHSPAFYTISDDYSLFLI